MDASAITDWSQFFIAAAGAAGALAGLVFVTLSINLARIVDLPGVPGRAGATIILLAGALCGSLVVLVPSVSQQQLAVLLLAVTLPTWAVPMLIQRRSKAGAGGSQQRPWLAAMHTTMHQVAAVPGILAGLSLFGVIPGGLAWFAFGVIASMLVALLNAWVLLVEILR
jgi:modulator of FtsH protease